MKNKRLLSTVILILFFSTLIIFAQKSEVANDCCPQKETATTNVRKSLGKDFLSRLPDANVTDQNGKKLRFYSDLIKDKVVVINFIFTNCSYVCPRQGQHFARLQREFGERLNKDIFMISVSIDPKRDTPERLEEWGKKYGRKEGWTLITGEVEEIEKLLAVFTGDKAGETSHSPLIFLGNDTTSRWIRTYGFTEPEEIVSNLIAISQVPIDEGESN